MSALRRMMVGAYIVFAAAPAFAQQSQAKPAPQSAASARDGQHDFDFEMGDWTTNVRVLRNPLSGAAPNWGEYRGASLVRPVMNGRANTVELSVASPTGKIEGIALRLYNPQSRQWSLNYASLGNGMLTPPVFGSFDGRGRGTFYGQDMIDGRAILVRFVITQVSAKEAHFEQAYSADGGSSWEVNWVAVDTKP